jgi:hypothetical protein
VKQSQNLHTHTHTNILKQKKMDISTLVPLPVRISSDFCKLDAGVGVAVCQDLLVVSSANKLQVFALPDDIIARGDLGTPRDLVHVRTMGGDAPMEFHFGYCSGCMAFTDGGETTLLLVTDAGQGAVHVIDVVRGTHLGYVAAPGTIVSPQGVATRKSVAAFCCWVSDHGFKVVRVFEGSGASWTAVRVIVGGIVWPYGLRFTADGLRLVVANGRGVSIFCAKDGARLRHIALDVYPVDVEECDIHDDGGMRAGWVVRDYTGLVAVADNASYTRRRDLGLSCNAFVLVPGLGFVVRHSTGVQFLATPDAVAMASMSSCKVAWMVAVCRRGLL